MFSNFLLFFFVHHTSKKNGHDWRLILRSLPALGPRPTNHFQEGLEKGLTKKNVYKQTVSDLLHTMLHVGGALICGWQLRRQERFGMA